MAQIKNLKNRKGEKFFPVTSTKGVFDEHGHDLDTLLDGKVDKVVGKQLTTNDYTTADKDKLDALPTNELLTQTFAGKQDAGTALRKTEQTLTDEERTQVRKNLAIGTYDATGRWVPQSFIDQWNLAASDYGRYNEATGFFELYGLTDITYRQAIPILKGTRIGALSANSDGSFLSDSNIRASMPLRLSRGALGASETTNLFTDCVKMEECHVSEGYANSLSRTFQNCRNLRKISFKTVWSTGYPGTSNLTFSNCVALEEIEAGLYYVGNVDISWSPRLSSQSIRNLVAYNKNTKQSTITLHPDAYARVTNEIFALAAEKNITIATT